MSFHEAYHHYQAGRGVSNVYVGAPRMRGHGLGSWFSGIFRSALPYIIKGARSVGKEALKAGVHMVDDVVDNDLTFKDSLNHRLRESGKILKRKARDKIIGIMDGSGYKSVIRKPRIQSRRAVSRRRISRKRMSVRKNQRVSKKKSLKARKKKRIPAVKRKNSLKRRKRKARKSQVPDIFN